MKNNEWRYSRNITPSSPYRIRAVLWEHKTAFSDSLHSTV